MSDFQKSFSQCGEDIIILFLARHVLQLEKIYYLDLGANEPDRFNNTYLLYDNGYRGVSVDANPYFASRFKDLRPDDVFVCCGVGAENSNQYFFEIEPHTLSTFSEMTAKQYTENGTHKLISKKKCPIYTVETLISKYCAEAPNILSLDVEGLDFEILQSINYKEWKPTIICVETLTYTEDATEIKLQPIIDYLDKKGYRVYADTYINTIFVDKTIWEQR